LLAIAPGAIGCGTADEVEPGLVTVDSAEVRAPAAVDATSDAADPSPEDVLRAALDQLLRGPSDPQTQEHSWFSSATTRALRSVSVDSAGHATVDFEDLRALIPNASSSAGSALLLEELNTTVFSVEGVRSVDYLIEGSCDRFWEWLQYGCQTIDRPSGNDN
jgi:spore germination protein GerM